MFPKHLPQTTTFPPITYSLPVPGKHTRPGSLPISLRSPRTCQPPSETPPTPSSSGPEGSPPVRGPEFTSLLPTELSLDLPKPNSAPRNSFLFLRTRASPGTASRPRNQKRVGGVPTLPPPRSYSPVLDARTPLLLSLPATGPGPQLTSPATPSLPNHGQLRQPPLPPVPQTCPRNNNESSTLYGFKMTECPPSWSQMKVRGKCACRHRDD